MTPIEWRDEFSVGVPSVDHEHRELIDLINSLSDQASRARSRKEVVAVLGEIYAQIAAHFALEEKIMRTARYDGLPEHKGEHEQLLDELRDIMDRVEDDGSYDDERMTKDLETWFTVHFRTQDARLHGALGR